MSRFGELVRQARLDCAMTLEKLARKCRSSKGYLSGIENGKVNPPRPTIARRMGEALGLNLIAFEEICHLEKLPASIKAYSMIRQFMDAIPRRTGVRSHI